MTVQSTRKRTGTAYFEVECDPDVLPTDFIYLGDDGVARKAKADNPATMPAVGYVLKKRSGIKAVVTKIVVEDLEEELVNTGVKNFFISETEAGKIQAQMPTTAGSVMQNVGKKLSQNKVLISVDSTAVVRS